MNYDYEIYVKSDNGVVLSNGDSEIEVPKIGDGETLYLFRGKTQTVVINPYITINDGIKTVTGVSIPTTRAKWFGFSDNTLLYVKDGDGNSIDSRKISAKLNDYKHI